MSFLRRLRSLFRRNQLDRDMAEEMRFHLDERTDDHLDDGMRLDEARAAAHRKFGGVAQIQETVRDGRGLMWLESAWRDIRYALRQLRKSPGFTAVVVLTLALGIGATTAIYSVVDAVLLNPIPGPHSDRLFQIGQFTEVANRPEPILSGVSPPIMEALEENRDLFANFTWFDGAQLQRQDDGFVSTVFGAMVPPGFFALFGERPLLGRTFTDDEAIAFPRGQPQADTTMVINYRWWQREFGRDPNVLGTTIELDDRQFTIIGVMPEHFQYPFPNLEDGGTQFWVPAEPFRPESRTQRFPNTQVIVRLKPDVPREQVQTMLDTMAARLMDAYPGDEWGYGQSWRRNGGGLRLWCRPLLEMTQEGFRYDTIHRTLIAFLVSIAFILAIVCANVANLALARAEQRHQEFAIRAALGAGRLRLVRQIITEHVLLACVGGVAGLTITAWGIRILMTFSTLPQLRPVEIDTRMLGITFAVAIATGLFFGVAPAWRASRARKPVVAGSLGSDTQSRRAYYRGTLVVMQVALAFVLLTGAGLMMQSIVQLLRVEPGFDPANLVRVHVSLWGDAKTLRNADYKTAAINQIHGRLSALPGVSAVGLFKNSYNTENIVPSPGATPLPAYRAYTGVGEQDFFGAAMIPLLGGRTFEPGDLGENMTTVLVNQTMADMCWPGENPVGQQFEAPARGGSRMYEVVGVVGDARLYRFDEELRPLFFRPHQESRLEGTSEAFVVQTQSAPGVIIPMIRTALRETGLALRPPTIESVQQQLFDSTRAQRTFRNYLIVFAAVGLLLAALGIYGVLAYSVARRTKEIGIRMAIGAERRDVLRLIMTDGARLIVVGVVFGLLAAFWLTRYLQSQLFKVSPTDPTVIASVVIVLSAVALAACYLPARRAAKVDPVIALRAE